MPSVVVVRRYPQGPRVWLLGQRVHHGATGCVLAACAARSRHAHALLALGAILAAHDRADVRVWFRREGVPAGDPLDTARTRV